MYLNRVVDEVVTKTLGYSGGVLLEGVRACGKTETGRRHSKSEVALDSGLPAIDAALAIDPALLLTGDTPRLIDEWQLEPNLWNVVRREIDARQARGQFILTGSSVPAEDARRHSGAHRISTIRMRPMTLTERFPENKRVSLESLFEGTKIEPQLDSFVSVPDGIDQLVHGGWPSDHDLSTAQAQSHLRDYVDDVISSDVARLDGEPSRDPDRMRATICSLARNIATEVTFRTIATDMSVSGNVKSETARAYLNALGRLFVVEKQNAWVPHLRSRAVVRTSPKYHFADPAFAVAALGGSTDALLKDLNAAGFFFESQVTQHLRVFGEALGAHIFHYRDSSGREIDAIVQLPDGRWGAVEVKIGQRQIPAAQTSLASVVETIDSSRTGELAFKAIITMDGPVVSLPDGTVTFPLAALGV
ncbi:MAG: ATP-binding protein [Actinomycetaceae bacterium]|nr:ATP-binding protein [Actinomycetaceae bacterium]